ncbi:recombinase family protein [Paenibacillus sp. VTT E-133280]|jgi:DNA invertase Pin-like site-specific DNA recombinase|uniref:recombinase family protein n=1 Tax=Paenibacillus sp. VTT E-133280 TaxID=1986222 RepID=UPI000BA00143|nr:recombinase family protein [Paenibacillus sp. VTT E-133280]OZQ62770.1 recombinase family protein [Paenibacillus sp. VTT E-133280]
MINPNVTAIYVRVSTTKESQKDSPEHQRGLCEEKARILDLDVQYSYEDRDTGTSIVAREEIQKLIRDAKAKYFRTIIFASLSRFSRDTLDSLNLKRILVDALGIRLISIEEGFDSLKDNDELKFQIISAVNQKLSEQISLSSKRGIRQSALKGNFTGSVAPFGYRKIVNGDRKTLVSDENDSYIVELIYHLYVSRKMGEKAIVKYLNEEMEIPAPKGGVWGITTIQRILTNEVYTGQNVFGKYEVKKVYNDINNMSDRSRKQVQRDKTKWERSTEQTHEAIIDRETFELAQEIRLKRGGGRRGGVRNRVNVFAGMIFCKHCGASLVSCKGKSRKDGPVYRYLICSTRRRQGEMGCVNNVWIPYNNFRDTVIHEVSKKLKQVINVESTTSETKDRILKRKSTNEMDKDLKKLEKAIQDNRKMLFELRKLNMLREIDEEQYHFEKQQYEQEIASLQSELAKASQNKEEQINLEKVYDEIRKALESLVELDFDRLDEMRLVLSKLIDKLVVSVDGEVEVYTPLGKLES